MTAFAQRWREHGLDIDISELWYHDERNDVAKYLDRQGLDFGRHHDATAAGQERIAPGARAGGRRFGGRQRLLHLDEVTNRGRRTD